MNSELHDLHGSFVRSRPKCSVVAAAPTRWIAIYLGLFVCWHCFIHGTVEYPGYCEQKEDRGSDLSTEILDAIRLRIVLMAACGLDCRSELLPSTAPRSG